MSPTVLSRPPFPSDLSSNPFISSHKGISPLLFDHSTQFDPPISDSDQMIFGPLDFEDYSFPWDPPSDFHSSPSLTSNFSHPSPSPPTHIYHDPPQTDSQPPLHDYDNNDFYLSHWVNDPDFPTFPLSSSLPIPARLHTHDPQRPSSCVPFVQHPTSQASSPEFPSLHAFPRSASPTKSFEEYITPHPPLFDAVSPQEMSIQPPAWASQLWDTSPHPSTTTSHHLLSSETSRRQRSTIRRDSLPGQAFQSSSAPSLQHRPMSLARTYSRRAESAGVSDDRNATIRRKRRISEESPPTDKTSDSFLSKSLLRPPKLAPSAWQLYFTDWIQRQQASSTRKLNVAQAAKEAGQEYANLSAEEKEPYKRRSQAAKEARERQLAAYMRTLTPEDIKRENLFRAAQRRAGKSRKSNIKDPNAPKKPLSAYFMFLQRIRSDPLLVKEVFGDETETTKQSVLAAAKWRSMTDDERKPFLAKAEQEKLDYEAARRLYEEGTVALGSSINFSILPGSPISNVFRARPVKLEPASSESESDELMTDDGTSIRF